MTTATDSQWSDRLNSLTGLTLNGTNIAEAFVKNMNGILDTMMNRIGKTVINAPDVITNPFGKYTKGIMDFGDTIQEYKVKYIKGQDFDPTNTNPFGQKTNKPIPEYTQINKKVQYKETIHLDQMKFAFTSEQTFGNFVSAKMESMNQSAAFDQFIEWKKFLSNGHFGTTAGSGSPDRLSVKAIKMTNSDEDDPDFAEELFKILRNYPAKMKLPSTAYNMLGDMAKSESVDAIMRVKDKISIDTEVLSGVYNLNKVGLDCNIMTIDDYATVATSDLPTGITEGCELICTLVDDRALSYTPRTTIGGSIYNPEGLYSNYFLTVQGTYGLARFRNLVQIYKPASS